MSFLDWSIVLLVTAVPAIYGLLFTKKASEGGEEGFFTADRKLSWWAIGISNTATYHGGMAPFIMLYFTFGLSANWLWWPQWIIWMPLVAVIWARLWRRLRVVTSAELISLRYGGPANVWARRIYALSMFSFAVILTGYATGFFAKTFAPLIPLTETQILLIFGISTVVYTMFGGLLGSVMASVVQASMFLIGALVVLVMLIPQFGGWGNIIERIMSHRPETLSQSPISNTIDIWTMIMFIVLGFFFPGSPVAGEGWTAQRFMAAKNESHAIGGQLFNAFLALGLRTFPLLGLGIVAISIFWTSDLGTVPAGFKVIDKPVHAWGELLLASKLPMGLLGLIVATEVAAFVSSLSALINWGSSFIVNDFYKDACPNSSHKQDILVSRSTSLIMFVLSAFVAILYVDDMISWFLFINTVVVIFWLPLTYFRFFWSRFNVWGELTSTIFALPLSILIWFLLDFKSKPIWQGLAFLFATAIIVIVLATLLTPAESKETLLQFYRRCQPMAGWKKFRKEFPLPPNGDPTLSHMIIDSLLGMLACLAMVLGIQSIFVQTWLWSVVYFTAAIFFGIWMVMRCLPKSSTVDEEK